MNLIDFSIDRIELYDQIEQQILVTEHIASSIKKKSGQFEDVLLPLEKANTELYFKWQLASHLQSVNNLESLRARHVDVLMKLTEHSTKLLHDRDLMSTFENVAKTSLSPDERLHVEQSLLSFKLNGVHLSDDKKKELTDLIQKSETLSSNFTDRVLDSTNVWGFPCQEEDLKGLNDSQKDYLKNQARAHNSSADYLLTLDAPGYQIAQTSLKNRDLRKKVYFAYNKRCSHLDESSKDYDNAQTVTELMSLRAKIGELLGYSNYRQMKLANRFASSEDDVSSFINQLIQTVRPKAIEEFNTLKSFAKDLDGLETLEPWDLAYYTEQHKKLLYDYNQEELRVFFPLDHVLNRMFAIFGHLYSFDVRVIPNASLWHPDVHAYELIDKKTKSSIGVLYMDLLARAGKQQGAWMGYLSSKTDYKNWKEDPIVYLVCNFQKQEKVLLTFGDVETLFHEFGHSLHHLLTDRTLPSISGLNQVPWDIVELPSQLQEQWCFDPNYLKSLTRNVVDQQPLSDEFINKIIQSKNHLSALMLLRQLEFAGFDWHLHEHKTCDDVVAFWKDYRRSFAVTPITDQSFFPLTFSHIFGGGYSAGYYSYLWAETYCHQVYEKIQQANFSAEVGEDFKKQFLSRGGDLDLKISLHRFLGEPQNIKPLLRSYGFAT